LRAGGGAPLPFLEAELDILLELPKLFLELPVLVLKRLDLPRQLTGHVFQAVQAHHEFGCVLRLRGAQGGHRDREAESEGQEEAAEHGGWHRSVIWLAAVFVPRKSSASPTRPERIR
jgi:hypothetical protein